MGRFPYEIAEEYADIVRATAMVESNENPQAIGDGGQAIGLMQIHPGFFIDYYGRSKRFPANTTDTWIEAQIKTVASYYDLWNGTIDRDLLIQGYRLGLHAVMAEGKRDPQRLERIYAALNAIKAMRITIYPPNAT